MERLTEECWRNLDPWECCGQDHYCKRGCHEKGGCTAGCIVPKLYARLAAYEDAMSLERVVELAQADAEPVRHGRWTNIRGGFWEIATCDQCGERSPTGGIAPNYCPNCGAKMDGGEQA